MGYLEVSRFTDGWDACLPYIEIYSIYDINEIKYNYLEIIHNLSLQERLIESILVTGPC